MLILTIFVTFVACILTLLVVLANLMRDGPGAIIGGSLLLVGWGVAALFWFTLLSPARAHDHNHPERNEWLKSLHSKEKTWCCDGNDTDAIEEWETKGNKYRVKFGGQWFDVPEGALVDGPNKQGEALLWMNKGWGGPSVRCFMPGALT